MWIISESHCLSKEGEYVDSWGEDVYHIHDFNAPHGIVVDPNNDVFVSDFYGTIRKFDSEGNYLFSFGEADPPDGFIAIHAIGDDKWGNVYSVGWGTDGFAGEYDIEKYNNSGDFVCGINLTVNDYSIDDWAFVDENNWAFVDENGYLYVVFRRGDVGGYEIFAPK